MGILLYGNQSEPVGIPDAMLAHVKVVLSTKLRRNEAFTLSWRHTDEAAPGRTTLWIQPSIPLRFVFDSDQPETLDPKLLQQLANQANSAGGLTIDLSSAVAGRPVQAA